MARHSEEPPAHCPDCGEPLSLGDTFCKACGWDRDLFEADVAGDGAELPEGELDDDDYAAFLGREGLGDRPRPKGKELFIALAALLALIGFVLVFVLRGR